MKRRQAKVRKMPETPPDISFPPPYTHQAKYLKIADDFLALSETQQDQSAVISIDRDRPVATKGKRVA